MSTASPNRQPAESPRFACSLEKLLGFVASLGALLAGCGASADPEPSADRRTAARPSIVLISIDTLSARHLSLYGYGRETSPELDRFAEQAIVFETCRANAGWTTPSYVSQFTGLYPSSFDRRRAPDGSGSKLSELERWRLPEAAETLTERLRAAGYRTAAFVDNPLAGPEAGLGQGFELFDLGAAEISVREEHGGLRHIVPRALDWIDSLEGDDPFFLFVQALDVHGPYTPSAPFKSRFTAPLGAEPSRAPIGKNPILFGCIPPSVAWGVVGDGELPRNLPTEPIAAAYDEEILYVDDALGELFRGLEQRGVLDEAVTVLTADHGESMLEHDWLFNHGTVYDESLLVPFVVRLPQSANGGTRVAAAVQLVDLAPTVEELAGLPERIEPLHGHSLVAHMAGNAVEARPILAEAGLFQGTALVHDGWKLVERRLTEGPFSTFVSLDSTRRWLAEHDPKRFGGKLPGPNQALNQCKQDPELKAAVKAMRSTLTEPAYELFNLREDPAERRDLATERPEQLRAMRARLERERARIEPLFDDATPGDALDAERYEELRRLGYVGDEEE